MTGSRGQLQESRTQGTLMPEMPQEASQSRWAGLERVWRVYIVPGAVFQSLMIGGGYGTGREIVEYYSRYGIMGGLAGLLLATLCFAVLLSVSFALAREFTAYDYRRFLRELLGRGWVAFEVLYLAMFALVLAVVCAATAGLMQEYLQVPAVVGVGSMLLLVVVFAFYGRQWVTRILAFKAVLLSLVFLAYFFIEIATHGHLIARELGQAEVQPGWVAGALRYVLYTSVVIPTMLFAVRNISTRHQAVVAGMSSALIGMLPAILMHITFAAGYPQILARALPAYWMIAALGLPALTIAYLVVLFGSLFDVGIGFIQSLNERIDGWAVQHHRRRMSGWTRAGIAVACLLASGALSFVGVVPLIAQGYSAMAYGFLVLFVAPLLSVGVYRLIRGGSPRE